MWSIKTEQWIVVKFHMKLEKTATETYNLLKNCMAMNVYRVHVFLSGLTVFKMAETR